ncbi:MarR family winged helix-turn-helix transcriptional regulator [Geomesophilobacter sediminis]|uniref:MarR family transcriptional regulator n=1 Tax=Geomesophilobacter sediminis TaxID=2798584 RepID=A0A8J7S7R0_9BACT|nr:MarR family transcriptional regulator [Geomesophilobacter sediminis]MBJ6727166.1 MarR family transcriptional regulator [Geomesophilobacter sediminis]
MFMTRKNKAVNTIEDFVLAIGLIVRRVRADAPREFQEFSWTQKAVLSRLEKDGPTTTAALARAEGIKPQSMSTAIASLETMGLVERKAHSSDGRQINIALTEKGTAMRKSLKEAKQHWLSEAFSQLDEKERAVLFQAGEIMKRMAERS